MTAATTSARAAARQPGAEALALTRRFPPRPVPESWPQTAADRFAVMRRMLAPPFLAENVDARHHRKLTMLKILDWLELHPGATCHADINTTMGYKAVYPQEAINGHRAYIARRRQLRPSEEYRTPTDAEWDEFLGHFEHRRVVLGDCGRAYSTSCIHEHSCIRCPLLRIDPAQRHRLEEIRDNLLARITEAEREGWAGEAEGLKVSLAAANNKLAQADLTAARRAEHVNLGIPVYRDIAATLTGRGPHDN